ncbi:MAG: undecaprenyldiphospho-muramoylpentapeptide beta-N-acetylglucosaminyltransferase [Planctomycetota bacterium]
MSETHNADSIGNAAEVRRIIFAGGGTGGHIMPGLALADAFMRDTPGGEVLFIGGDYGLEKTLIPANGYQLETLPDARLKGKLGALASAAKLTRALFRARRIIADFKPDAVVGLGGYASFAPVLAASYKHIPVYLMEQNAIPGRVTRMLSRFATAIFNQYDCAAEYLPGSVRDKCRAIGNPMRQSIIDAAVDCPRTFPSDRVPTLLAMGGSQGARAVNQLIIRSLKPIKSRIGEFRLIHIAGNDDVSIVQSSADTLGIEAIVVPFTDQIADFYRQADLVIARSGATSISEIAIFGIPSIFIPLPTAADNHQDANARILSRLAAAVRIRQPEATPIRLADAVSNLLTRRGLWELMSKGMKSFSRPDAAARWLNIVKNGQAVCRVAS